MERKKESWINPITVKFRKYGPGLIFLRGLFLKGPIFGRGEGDMGFKIDWASLIHGSKFTVFRLCHSVFEGNFLSTSPRGAYIWKGDLTEVFFALPVWGAYIWRGLYMEFYGNLIMLARVSFHPFFLRINDFKKQGEINHIYHITKGYK